MKAWELVSIINLGRKVRHRYWVYLFKKKTKNKNPDITNCWSQEWPDLETACYYLGLSLSDVNRGLWIQCSDKFLLPLKFHEPSVIEIRGFMHQLGSKGWCDNLRVFGDNVRCSCVQCLLWIPPNWWHVCAGLLSPRSHTGLPRIGTTEGEEPQECSALAPSAGTRPGKSLLRLCCVKDNVGLEALSPSTSEGGTMASTLGCLPFALHPWAEPNPSPAL